MDKKEESPLFIGITNGNELRRSMLECSKGILESLKEHEKFKGIREEKLKTIQQLKNDIKGISRLITTLRTNLPKVNDVGVMDDIGIKRPEIKKVEKPRIVKVGKPEAVKVEKPKAKTELEKLESELSEIENKLDSLS